MENCVWGKTKWCEIFIWSYFLITLNKSSESIFFQNNSDSLVLKLFSNRKEKEIQDLNIGKQDIQMSTSNKFWRGCGEKGTLLHCWWECKLVQPLWRTVWRFLTKLEIELPYDPAIPLLGIHTEETRIERDMCTLMFITALFIIVTTRKQPRCPPADERIKKQWYIYTMEYYSAIKKNTF